jgi:uncharacterized protein (TIGR02118 family)
MANQLKKIAFLARRPDLTHEQFTRHWREQHGPLVARSPGYEHYRLGYAQNHVLGETAIGRPFPWSGMAEFWLPGEAPNEDDFSSTAIYRDRIAVDERLFIDMGSTVSTTATETRIIDGHGPAKVVIVAAGVAGTSSSGGPAFAEHALSRYPGLDQAVAGWAVNDVIPGTFRLPGAHPLADLRIDAIHELWFASGADCAAAVGPLSQAATGWLDPDRTTSFLAEEIVYFRDGRPVGRAAQP